MFCLYMGKGLSCILNWGAFVYDKIRSNIVTEATRKPTLAMIAERAHVSKSTVSLALSGAERIHPKTRQRILALAEELCYVPPRERLRSDGVKTIGVLLDRQFSWTGESFFTRIVQGVENEAELAGCDVLVATVDVSNDDFRRLPAFVERNMVDGVIVVGITNMPYLQELEAAGKHMVVVSGGDEGLLHSDYVLNDDYQGIRQEISHLKALGHRRIAMIGACLQHLSNLQRYRAFRIYMEEMLGGYDRELVDVSGTKDTPAEGRQMVERLIDNGARFTALVCMTDELAFGALEGLKSKGLRVHDDVSVVGYDDFQFAALCDPPLTSVRIDCEDMGEVAFQVLRNRLQGYSVSHPQRILVGPDLVIRESTSKPPACCYQLKDIGFRASENHPNNDK